jgi:hypothetical protein
LEPRVGSFSNVPHSTQRRPEQRNRWARAGASSRRHSKKDNASIVAAAAAAAAKARKRDKKDEEQAAWKTHDGALLEAAPELVD